MATNLSNDIIFAQSPFYVQKTVTLAGVDTDYIRMRLYVYVYSGEQTTDRPLEPTNIILKNYLDSNTSVVVGDYTYIFKINDVVKSYIDNISLSFLGATGFDNVPECGVWVDVQAVAEDIDGVQTTFGSTQSFFALYGRYLFKYGTNVQPANYLMSSNKTYAVVGENIPVFFYSENLNGYNIYKDGVLVGSATGLDVAPIWDNTSHYISAYVIDGSSIGTYKIDLLYNVDITETAYVYIQSCKTRYEPVYCMYLNKNGVYEYFVFTGGGSLKYKNTNQDYTKYIPSITTGTEANIASMPLSDEYTIDCYTGYIEHVQNDQIIDLLNSTSVYLNYNNNGYIPVVAATREIPIKTQNNDSLLWYNITFKIAQNNYRYA